MMVRIPAASATAVKAFLVYQTGSYMDGIGPIAGTCTYLYRTTAANAESATTAATTYAARSPPIQDIQGGENGRDRLDPEEITCTDSARFGLLETGCELEVDDSANDRAHRNQNAQDNSW